MSEALHILMVDGLVPWHPQVGGGSVIPYELAKALTKAGHQVDYVAVAPKEFQKDVEWTNILYASETMNGYLPFQLYFKTKQNIKNYDIIHVNNWDGFVFGLHRRLFRNVKLVVGSYAPKVHQFPLLRSPSEFLNFFTCHSADRVLCLSEYSRKNISKSYFIPQSKINVMYGGVNISFIRARQSKEKGDNFVLLFCGRLNGPHEQKGVDILLRAMPLIIKEHPVILEIIGTGSRAGKYQALARKLRIENKVRFLGFIEYNKLPEYYSNADLFVLPSRRESFGLTLAEAMASGLPVVSTNVTAIPEVVKDGENGILVPPNDPEKFAGAVNSLLDNPERMRKMGIKGRERVKENFTWEKVAERVLKYYEEIL